MRRHKKVKQQVEFANEGNAQSSKGSTTEQAKSESAVPKQRLTKAESNRKNSLKSTGPKTPRGKRYSRCNARTHGLYSEELLVSETDRPEFEATRVGLKAQLKPSTTLQVLAFDYIVACQWRCKLALRLERPQFARQFQEEQLQNEQCEAPDADPIIERWYGCGRADTRAGIDLLDHAIMQFERSGYFHEDTKACLVRAFGLDFVPFLEQWNTMSKDAILLAENLVVHRNEFGDVPETDVKSPSPPGEPSKVVVDPLQGRHMVVKLLEQKKHFLRELLSIKPRNTLDRIPDAAQSSEFNPRFLADAKRELRRALDWYLFLKDKGL
ncbi:MAG: hypothetical protein ABSD76_20365 [Terriglobales bacterium]|jgi:hypothetical protein